MASSPIYNWPEPDNSDLVKNGALAIRTLGNAIDTTMATMTPKSLVDAKGDLIAASAADTPARLAVGNNGETIVADSSTSTGLRYSANFAAGKNKIINGDFNIWQRGTTFTQTPSVELYTTDRWFFNAGGTGGTLTLSRQTFTPGAAPVAGYEGQYFFRYACTAARTSQTFVVFGQRIEDVRTFAGQTVTFSYWAKASSNVTLDVPYIDQYFGTGGSSSVGTAFTGPVLTTSWQRFTSTITVPSVSGKTIGANSSLNVIFQLGAINTTGLSVDFWGMQLEAGSVATAFQTATGTIQGELSACQRYFQTERTGNTPLGTAAYWTTTLAYLPYVLKTTMRVAPTVTFDGVAAVAVFCNGVSRQSTAIGTDTVNVNFVEIVPTTGAVTGGDAAFVRLNVTDKFINFSAEL